MNTISRFVATLILPILLTSAAVNAGSIWAKAACRQALHTDDTARRIGDSLTIIIDEHSVIENATERALEKTSDRKASIAGDMNLLDAINKATGGIFNIPDMSLSTSAETTNEGKADYDSDRKMADKITVTVADVLPNGNMVIVGTRERMVAGDQQMVQVSGVVRPSDITFANEVRSEKVAEFKIVFKNIGRERRFTRPGWLDRLLNITNPF